MEIINEIKPKDDKEKQKFVHRSLAEVQRAKLDKLMKNPEKPVLIPESTKRDKEYNAPSFVRNVMGSSAGAGSGEFHVYRHLRRKEYARQKHLKMQSETERLNDEYQNRLEDNQKKADDKTSKKRAKRLRQKMKAKEKKPKLDVDLKDGSNSEESENEEDGEAESEEDASKKDSETNDDSNDVPTVEPSAAPKPVDTLVEPSAAPKPVDTLELQDEPAINGTSNE